MSAPLGLYGGYKYEGPQTRALGTISREQYAKVWDDQGRLMSKLISDVSYMAQNQRKMQKGIDEANENVLQQIQGLITDLIVLFGGAGDTGLDFGDLKYVIQAIGALFGFADENGNITVPVNLFEVAWHFFSTYILPVNNFKDAIDFFIDAAIATVLDLFGEVPIVGQALQQLAVIISDIRDLLDPIANAVQAMFDALNVDLDDIPGIIDLFGILGPIWDALATALDGVNLPDFSAAFHQIALWSLPLVNMIAAAIMMVATLIKLFTGHATMADLQDSLNSFAILANPAGSPTGMGIDTFVAGIINNFLNPSGLITAILDPNAPLNAANLFGFLPNAVASLIPLGALGTSSTNFLPNATFDTADSLAGQGIWDWSNAYSHSPNGGSATVIGDGTLKELLQDPAIQVEEGHDLKLEHWVRWAGVTAVGAAFQLVLHSYTSDNGTGASTQTIIQSISNPAANSNNPAENNFQKLSGTYTVPAGIKSVRMKLVQTANVTAGQSWWDDGVLDKTQLLPIPFVDGLPDWMQGILNSLWQGLNNIAPIGNVLFADIIASLQAISPNNVVGLQGGTIIDTFETTINTLWGGFAQLLGGAGVKSIYDVAGQASDLVSTANTAMGAAEWNSALLSVRNNKSLMMGMDETTESNFLITDLFTNGTDPTSIIAANSGSVPMAFWRASETAKKGVISWFGKDFANVTALYIDIYRFNFTTNTAELIHSSTDQIGQVTASWGLCRYFLPAAARFDVASGGASSDVIGVAWRVTGTGTHNIAGKSAGSWLPTDTMTVPSKPAATRTGSGNIAFSSITWSGAVPWFGIGIATGDVPPDYHAPRTTQITTVGAFTYNVPDWADEVDEILCGAGGGGKGGDPAFFAVGDGGHQGLWATRTLVRGTDFGTGTGIQLTGSIGAGGGAGPWPTGSGGAGQATTRNAISGGAAAASAAGGAGGTTYSGQDNGWSPGNKTYNGVTYPGGGQASHGKPGANGQAPGGGGGGGDGGTWGVAWNGGAGARGVAYYVARQVL